MILPRTRLFALTAMAYRDLVRVLASLWPFALMATLIAFAAQLVSVLVPRVVTLPATGQALLGLVVDLVMVALVAPFIIAVHRFVLQGDIARRYRDERNRARARVIVPWLLAFVLATNTPSFLSKLLFDPSGLDAITYLLIWTVLSLFLTIRLIILVPALAVDAPGATWQNTYADTRGHAWYIFGALLLPFLPFLVIGIVLAMATASNGHPARTSLVFVTALSAMNIVQLPLGVIIISRLYQILGHRLDPALRADG
jgi:hypothetical protein